MNQRIATAMLEHLGYEVDVAADGQEAVDAALAAPYDAILMDCQLPLLGGYEATEKIRVAEGTTRHTPIVAVTGSSLPSEQQRCLAAGMDDCVLKPLTLKELDRVLARWILPDWTGDPRHAALDMEVVEHLRRLGESVGEDLIGQLTLIFVEDSEVAISALREALGDGDTAAVVRLTHALNGASANLGATDLSRMFAALERIAVAGGPLEPAPPIDAIETEFGRVRSALRSLTVTP